MKILSIIIGIIICLFISVLLLLYKKTADVPAYLSDGSIEYSSKNLNHIHPIGERILYWHILKSMNKNYFEIIKGLNNVPNNIYAYFIDLNNDGKKDIIGIEKDGEYHRFAVYILLKNKFGYSSKQSFLLNGYFENLYVLNNKTNGYKDIRAYGIFETYGDDCILKYDLKTNYYEISSCK